MELPQFPTHSTCTLCPLSAQPIPGLKVGIPTRHHSSPEEATPTTPLILIIGMNPDTEENREGRCFVGKTGRLLSDVLLPGSGLLPLSHIYLTNSARCYTPAKTPPNIKQFNTCFSYIPPDLTLLHSHHPSSPLHILLLGANAVKTFHAHFTPNKKMALASSFDHQGLPLSLSLAPTLSLPANVWHTYHPAALFRTPNLIHPVATHLALLRNSLLGLTPTPSLPNLVNPRPPFR